MIINYKDKKIEITQGSIIGEIKATEETIKYLKNDGIDLYITNNTIFRTGLDYVKSHMPELIKTNKYFLLLLIYSMVVTFLTSYLIYISYLK